MQTKVAFGAQEGGMQHEPGMGPLTQSLPLQPVMPPHCPTQMKYHDFRPFEIRLLTMFSKVCRVLYRKTRDTSKVVIVLGKIYICILAVEKFILRGTQGMHCSFQFNYL